MNWCFATINNRPGEIYFERIRSGQVKFLGYCYVKREDFTLKEERNAFDKDVKKFKIVCDDERYKIV